MKLLFPFVSLVLLLFVAGCGFDDDGPVLPPGDTRTVLEIIEGDADFSILVDALEMTGLDISLTGSSTFTIFAPNNAAFNSSGINLAAIDTTELENILLYHILTGVGRPRESILAGQLYVTTANLNSPSGDPVQLFIDRTNDLITLNTTAQLVGDQVIGTNGVVHTIDEVLRPPTVGDMIQQNTLLTDFAVLMAAADSLTSGISVLDTLKSGALFTVFAPIDNDFVFDPPISSAQLREVMLYHIVAGRSTRFNDFPGTLTTLQGDQLLFTGRTIRTTSVESHTLQFEDIQATNGLLHLVTSVLIPEGL